MNIYDLLLVPATSMDQKRCKVLIQSILSNLAIILLMHLFMSMVLNLRRELSYWTFRLSLILLVSFAVISMFYLPITFGNFSLDMRFIPLVFLGYIWGWKYALPALIIVSMWRFFIGGDGMLPGIVFGMVGPTLLALIFHHRSKLHGKHLERILLVSACWFLCDFPIIFFIPNGLEIFKGIALIRLSTFIATAIILYTFIALERQRRTLNEKLQRLAGEDPLTRLLNKRKFYEIIEKKIKTSGSHHYIAMLDLDHFKKLNDTYGHVIGDDVLLKVGKILKKYELDNLKIGRYGGEEFILYISGESLQKAQQIMEKIRTEIEETCFMLEQGKSIRITVSIGLAHVETNCHILHSVNEADKYLYLAKKNGRNRVITAREASILKSS